MLIDSHAHLGYDDLYHQIDAILKRAKEAGVEKIINICTDELTAIRGLEIQRKYPFVFNVGSTTPHDTAAEGEKNFPFFEKLAVEKKLNAIGETGLDYFYDYSPKKTQIEFFSRYLALAKKTSLPVVIHCRDAFDDLFSITKEQHDTKDYLLHCFTGNKEQAKVALNRGWKISISGIVTFKKSSDLQEVVRYLPLDAMMIETDSPYLAPHSKRGKVNEPSFLVETLKFIAKLKNLSEEELKEKTSLNTISFFNLM